MCIEGLMYIIHVDFTYIYQITTHVRISILFPSIYLPLIVKQSKILTPPISEANTILFVFSTTSTTTDPEPHRRNNRKDEWNA
jgi:hypothetical protein